MENVKRKKNHPSLPSNYVSIVDLKQRWLKQKEQEKEEVEQNERQREREIEEAEERERQREREKEEAEERERQRFKDFQKEQQPREPVVVVPTRSSPGICNIKKMQDRSKIRTDSGTNSRWISVTRDGNAEVNNKGKESWKMKKKKKKRNAKVVEKGKEISEESEFSEAVNNKGKESWKMKKKKKRNAKVVEKGKEISEESEFSEAKKCIIESGLNEVEKNVKQNPNAKEGDKRGNEATAKSESSEAKKSTSEIELNEEKKHDSIVDEVEEKFGGLSVKSGNGKQDWKIKKKKKKRNAKVVEKGKEISEESEFSEAKKCIIESGLNEVEKNVKQNPNAKEGDKRGNEATAKSESSEVKKFTAETKLNEEKKNDSMVDEVEEKFGGLSVKSGNGKQDWKIKRVNKGFGHSQSVRTNEYYFGSSRRDFSHRYDNFGRHNDNRNKVVWVKKGGNGNAAGGGGGEVEA